MSGWIGELREQIEREFGPAARTIDHLAGRLLLWSSRREAATYPHGRPLEPRTFVERRHWT